MPSFLCQLRVNGNVRTSTIANNLAGIVSTLREMAGFLEQKTVPESLDNLSIGVQILPEGKLPLQYQGVVLITLSDQQAQQEGLPSLEELKGYIEQAVEVRLDDDEHGNPHGVCRPIFLIDSLRPAEFNMPEINPVQVCQYFSRQGYRPYAICHYRGLAKEIISHPIPNDHGLTILVRDKDQPTTVAEVNLMEVFLKS